MPRRANAIEVPRAASSHRRAIFISLGLVLWMAAIGARLVQLQIHQHDDLAARARSQQLSSIDTAPTRGQVLDRQGRELARSLDTESFFADPSEITNSDDTARKISAITNQNREDLAKKLADARDTNKKFIWITRRLEMQAATKLDALELKGVYSRKEPKRFYPNDSLAAHVLGFVGTDEVGLSGVSNSTTKRFVVKAARFTWKSIAIIGRSKATRFSRSPARLLF